MYIEMNAQYALYEATHRNFLTFFVAILPYLWLAIFGLTATFAVVELRRTRRGYRYSLIQVLGSSLALSFVGGLVFQYVGFGYYLDQSLGQQINQYMSLEKIELKLWQAPEYGRLVGMLVPRPDAITRDSVLQFEDITGGLWSVSDSELSDREIELLTTKNRVRLLGTSTAPRVFHVCGVFPWMFERVMGRHEMEKERIEFETRMRSHKTVGDSLLRIGESASIPVPIPVSPDHICAELEMMERME
jgi:hypothetical protein